MFDKKIPPMFTCSIITIAVNLKTVFAASVVPIVGAGDFLSLLAREYFVF